MCIMHKCFFYLNIMFQNILRMYGKVSILLLMLWTAMFSQNTKTNFVQKPTTKPILDHSILKEEQFVIYLDKMPSVLQTCPYIFLHIPKPKPFKWPCFANSKKFARHVQNKNTPPHFLINKGKICKPYWLNCKWTQMQIIVSSVKKLFLCIPIKHETLNNC